MKKGLGMAGLRKHLRLRIIPACISPLIRVYSRYSPRYSTHLHVLVRIPLNGNVGFEIRTSVSTLDVIIAYVFEEADREFCGVCGSIRTRRGHVYEGLRKALGGIFFYMRFVFLR